jgi:hypothetical protein
MNKERDWLPWILGGLSAAAIAVAFAAVSSHRAAPISPSRLVAAQSPTSPTTLSAQAGPPVTAQAGPPATAPDAAPVSAPLSGPASAPALAQAAVEPAAPEGQIWECTTKGVKTFSNNPCGERSTLLDVGPINTMSPTHAVHYMGGPEPQPRYTAGYADQSGADAGDTADDYSDQNAAEVGANSYAVVQRVRVLPHRHHEHPHPPPAPHNTSGPARRN